MGPHSQTLIWHADTYGQQASRMIGNYTWLVMRCILPSVLVVAAQIAAILPN